MVDFFYQQDKYTMDPRKSNLSQQLCSLSILFGKKNIFHEVYRRNYVKER